MFWSIVQTYSQRETTTNQNLSRRGFETYLPKIREQRRLTPLFPGYLFVRIFISWYPILSTTGVLRLLRTGDEPCRVDDALVARIRKQEVRGVVRLPKTGLKQGDSVKIVRGSFKDHIGIYDGMHGKARSKILLELLGREVPIDLPIEDFQPIATTA